MADSDPDAPSGPLRTTPLLPRRSKRLDNQQATLIDAWQNVQRAVSAWERYTEKTTNDKEESGDILKATRRYLNLLYEKRHRVTYIRIDFIEKLEEMEERAKDAKSGTVGGEAYTVMQRKMEALHLGIKHAFDAFDSLKAKWEHDNRGSDMTRVCPGFDDDVYTWVKKGDYKPKPGSGGGGSGGGGAASSSSRQQGNGKGPRASAKRGGRKRKPMYEAEEEEEEDNSEEDY